MNIIEKKSIDLVKNKKIQFRKQRIKINKKKNIYIKVDSCGICSSDLKFIKTGSRIKKFPITLGHEISGSISKNKNVILCAEIPCGNCYICRKKSKFSNLCNNPISIGSSFDGGFSNYLVVEKKTYKKIPKIIYSGKILKYASLAESIACVINGLEIAEFNKNKSIIVIGAGYMGILFISIANIFKSKKIAVVDYDLNRLKLAKKMGANYLYKLKINKNSNVEKVLKPTYQNGYDIVISANGNKNSHEFATRLVSKRGIVNIFGGTPKNTEILLNSNYLHYRESKITGSFSSNFTHLKKAFSIIKSKKIDFSKIVSSYANFDNFKSKIKRLIDKKEVKVIFKPYNEI